MHVKCNHDYKYFIYYVLHKSTGPCSSQIQEMSTKQSGKYNMKVYLTHLNNSYTVARLCIVCYYYICLTAKNIGENFVWRLAYKSSLAIFVFTMAFQSCIHMFNYGHTPI